MKAIGKYIVIDEVKETETKTDGGLLLAEAQREDIRYRKGIIINTGTDVSAVNSGDTIYYDRHAGFNVEINKQLHKVIKEQDIVIVI